MHGRLLGVSLDHVASLREVAGAKEPDPVVLAGMVEGAGASQVKVHLREDKRHIQDRDVRLIREVVTTSLNMQMAATQDMLKSAYELKPDEVTLVPEHRDEVCTEGGLDVNHHRDHLKRYIGNLRDGDIGVVLYIEPEIEQVRAAHRLDANQLEISTRKFCDARGLPERRRELQRIVDTVRTAKKLGMRVSAGGKMTFPILADLIAVDGIFQFNMGHAIFARALVSGVDRAVRDAAEILRQ